MTDNLSKKRQLLDRLISQMEETLSLLVHTAHEARAAATNEESKAENKYDTRGLEASYLAGAQAKRSEDLKQSILLLKRLQLREFGEGVAIQLTALVHVEDSSGEQRTFFLLPTAGGSQIPMGDQMVFVLTPESPIGKALIGKSSGDSFQLQINRKQLEYEILSVD